MMSLNDAKNDRLAIALATERTIAEAAETAGLSRKTVQRRLADPDFAQRCHELRAEMTQRTLDKLVEAQTAATDTLLNLLNAESEAVRLAAARTILEMTCRLGEHIDRRYPGGDNPPMGQVILVMPDNGRWKGLPADE